MTHHTIIDDLCKQMHIKEGNSRCPKTKQIIDEHICNLKKNLPRRSVHALSHIELQNADITLWTAWYDHKVIGCGAIKELDYFHGEIKSIYTCRSYRGLGVAANILAHIIDVARRRAYCRLSLEVAATQKFAPARSLYSKFGFKNCQPFGDYLFDPNSEFMALDLR